MSRRVWLLIGCCLEYPEPCPPLPYQGGWGSRKVHCITPKKYLSKKYLGEILFKRIHFDISYKLLNKVHQEGTNSHKLSKRL
jgi:hypothetical protein